MQGELFLLNGLLWMREIESEFIKDKKMQALATYVVLNYLTLWFIVNICAVNLQMLLLKHPIQRQNK